MLKPWVRAQEEEGQEWSKKPENLKAHSTRDAAQNSNASPTTHTAVFQMDQDALSSPLCSLDLAPNPLWLSLKIKFMLQTLDLFLWGG